MGRLEWKWELRRWKSERQGSIKCVYVKADHENMERWALKTWKFEELLLGLFELCLNMLGDLWSYIVLKPLHANLCIREPLVS